MLSIIIAHFDIAFCLKRFFCRPKFCIPKATFFRLLCLSFSFNRSCNSITSSSPFHQHFTSSLYANFLSWKNYKTKLWAHKSCAKHFGMKKLLVESWWNWHLEPDIFVPKMQNLLWQMATGKWRTNSANGALI